MTSNHDGDLPKTVAVIMMEIPGLALGTGWAYLRMKRRIHEGSKYLMKGLLESGMPREMAHELADQYESDLSVRKLVHGFGGPSSSWRDWKD